MDLDSTNGTYLNGERIEGSRYYGRRGGVCFSIELREGDELRFGYSTRTYILLNENSVDTSEAKPENEVKSDHEDVLWRVCWIVCFYPFSTTTYHNKQANHDEHSSCNMGRS